MKGRGDEGLRFLASEASLPNGKNTKNLIEKGENNVDEGQRLFSEGKDSRGGKNIFAN